MMKCVIPLVVLMHFCYGFTLKRDLNREIIQGLDHLRKLYSQNKVNFTSPDPIRTPALLPGQRKHASSCVHIFVGELVRVLNNLTVDDSEKAKIDGLKLNLNKMDLEPDRTIPRMECPMNDSTSAPFNLYRAFFMQLNKSKKT